MGTFGTPSVQSGSNEQQVAENASKLGADPSKGFIVSGASAGGNLAAVAAHEAADAKLSPPLTGVFLCIPFLVHPDAVPEKYKPHYNSWEENKDAMILDQRGMLWFFGKLQRSFLRDQADGMRQTSTRSIQHRLSAAR